MKTNNESPLQELFIGQLRDILWAEKQLLKALPKKAAEAKNPALVKALEGHKKETEVHIQRLDKIFQSLGLAPRAKKCDAMEGLLKEGDELAEEYADSPAIDAALICAGQKVEHYEIATYGTLKAFATHLGLSAAATLLQATLEEECAADEKLSEIALSSANESADE
jgi:ferritin-like metal-binding protein YciE